MVRGRSLWKRAALALTVVAGYASLAKQPSVDAQRALREHLTPKLTSEDCAHILRLTPEEAAALGWFHHRALSGCKDINELLGGSQPPIEAKKTEVKDTIAEQSKAQIAAREQWVPKTPDEAKARADAELRAKELASVKAEIAAKEAEFKKQSELSAEQRKANEAKTKAYNDKLQQEAEARAVEEQKLQNINRQVELDRAQKQNDAAQAELDAKLREDFVAAQKADLERQKADEAAQARENQRLGEDKVQRDADKQQEEADRRQAEADQQSADAEQKAKNQAQREQNAKTRAENEVARQNRESEFKANEEARLTREREAEAAAAERQRAEEDMRKEDEARAKRQENFDENENARAAREKEFAEAEAAREARLKKMKEEEDAREAEAKKRRDEDAKAADELDGKKKDLDGKEKEIPHEEKPKRDDEEDCKSGPGGAEKVTCHNGGVCFQKKDDPASKRCKCEKGFKGDKCEYEACTVKDEAGNIKTGNKVDGKCVRWHEEYKCPGCNREWSLTVSCVEIHATGKETTTSISDCSKMKKPENELKDETCEFCFTSCKLKSTTRSLRQEAFTTLQPTPSESGVNYRYAPSCGYDYLDNAFVYSKTPHIHKTDVIPETVTGTTMEKCLELCWEARGEHVSREGYYNGKYELTEKHCTFVFWRREGGTCKMYNRGDLPKLPEPSKEAGNRQSDRITGTGFMAFVSFARRFDISRSSECSKSVIQFPAKEGTHQVCPDNGIYEGTGAFYSGFIPNDDMQPSGKCAATYETVLDAALHYEMLAITPLRPLQRLAHATAVPGDLKSLRRNDKQDEDAQHEFSVVSSSSNIKWNYKADFLYRVKSVVNEQPITISPTWAIDPPGREDISPQANQIFFNYLMHNNRAAKTKSGLAGWGFDAGHLVAAAQKPPNFFFNYVPQHKRSNQGGGCWWFTEIAATDFMRLGCNMEYKIDLTYPDEDSTLQQTLGSAKIPDWARTVIEKDVTSRAYKDGDTLGFDAQCHYRFRPISMSLTYEIKGVADPTRETTCSNMWSSGGWGGQLLTVKPGLLGGGYIVQVSRVKAYLIQKWNSNRKYVPERPAPASRSRAYFKKLFMTATAMYKSPQTDVVCLAEVGYTYPFRVAIFTPEFSGAFLSLQDNSRCLGVSNLALSVSSRSANCLKWSYPDPGETAPMDGREITSGALCIQEPLTGTTPLVQAFGTNTNLCAKFVYSRDPAAMSANRLQTHNPRVVVDYPTINKLFLDNLVDGVVTHGVKCLMIVNDVLQFVPHTRYTGCIEFRVSYYPVTGVAVAAAADDVDDENNPDVDAEGN